MRDCWYSDRRDLIKWGTCVSVALEAGAEVVLQVACLRPDDEEVSLSGGHELPNAVRRFFRDVRRAEGLGAAVGSLEVRVLDEELADRAEYWSSMLGTVAGEHRRKVVLLDPDTGFAPSSGTSLEHVLADEVAAVFDVLNDGDALVVYQHARRAKGWADDVRRDLAAALGEPAASVSIITGSTRRGRTVRRVDVAFLVVRKGSDHPLAPILREPISREDRAILQAAATTKDP